MGEFRKTNTPAYTNSPSVLERNWERGRVTDKNTVRRDLKRNVSTLTFLILHPVQCIFSTSFFFLPPPKHQYTYKYTRLSFAFTGNISQTTMGLHTLLWKEDCEVKVVILFFLLSFWYIYIYTTHASYADGRKLPVKLGAGHDAFQKAICTPSWWENDLRNGKCIASNGALE